MTVEIIIPSLRQQEPETLVWSLAQQTQPPDLVTIVSNEIVPFENPGVRTRILHFESEAYGVGDLDVALRQNVGIFASEADAIIIQGDDQIAPPGMVEATLDHLLGNDHVWGNHRLIDWTTPREEIRVLSASRGASREYPEPPTWHGHYSCYGGMFGAKTEMLQEVGGFDMAFNGRHGSEDQALGYRLMRRAGQSRVWIADPPFSWHPMELKNGDTRARAPWLTPLTNGCGRLNHVFIELHRDGVPYLQCQRCPVWRFEAGPIALRDEVLIRYQPELVKTTSVWL